MMIEAGFRGPLTLVAISNTPRVEMNYFFHDLIKFLLINCDVRHKLISDRLYKRYLKFDEINAAYSLMKKLENDFLKKHELIRDLYCRYFKAFYEVCEEFFLQESSCSDKSIGRIQVSIVTTPYHIFEKLLPDKFYDNLPAEAEPYWIQTISMKEYVKKYSKDPEVLEIVEKW
ncbi:hypothetical protein ACWA5Z_11115 [Testudinibacter sp. P80/BLE/0925]|uniref:hypothetical protein n=1 Tax=Testudinibacter sp. TW-1 TaxID=3417757 RepID=UPI003D36E6B0